MLGSKLCCARQTSFDGILRPWELTQHKPAPGWWTFARRFAMDQKNCLCCTTVYRPNDVPFSDERERYLRYCAEQGATPASLKIKRNELLWIAKRLDLDAHLGIGIEVLQQIGNERQRTSRGCHRGAEGGRYLATMAAISWLVARPSELSQKPGSRKVRFWRIVLKKSAH
jgi:hypothetical protein